MSSKKPLLKSAYPLSFTSAALLPNESVTLAELFLALENWEEVYQKVDAGDLFSRNKVATQRRLFNELSLRLKTLVNAELELLVSGSAETRNLLLWQAVCRAYPFVGNFVRKVVRPKIAVLDLRLIRSDYQGFLREESEQYPRLEELADSTREKIQTRLFYFLEEVGILLPGDDRHLRPLLPAAHLCEVVSEHGPYYLEFWLLSNAEINRYSASHV